MKIVADVADGSGTVDLDPTQDRADTSNPSTAAPTITAPTATSSPLTHSTSNVRSLR